MNVLKYTWRKVVKEVMKCVLLCNRCHVEVEEGIQEIKESDIPSAYYDKFRESLKPAKSRFKSKAYGNNKKRNTAAARGRKTSRRTGKKKP